MSENNSIIEDTPLGVEGKAARFNAGKPQLSEIMLFDTALDDLAKVMEMGGIKYEPGNWLKGGWTAKQYLDCAVRHIRDHMTKGLYDADLGTKHIAQAVWNLLAAMCLCEELQGPPLDPDFDVESFLSKYA